MVTCRRNNSSSSIMMTTEANTNNSKNSPSVPSFNRFKNSKLEPNLFQLGSSLLRRPDLLTTTNKRRKSVLTYCI